MLLSRFQTANKGSESMKVSIFRVIGLAAVLYGPCAYAEKADCESLVELGSALDDIRNGLTAGEEVDDKTYTELEGVIGLLRAVADEEENNNLDSALDELEQAHTDNDRDGFVVALERVDTVFEAFYNADCG